MEKSFFAKYMHEGKCLPQEASCLIKGINPEECRMIEEGAAYDDVNKCGITYTHST